VPDQPDHTASPLYALGQLQHALETAARSAYAGDRGRAQKRARRWQDVLAGMASGRLEAGSRTPVTGTPAWVTLGVAHGGFATGRYLAEAPLTTQEAVRLASLPPGVPGEADREQLNPWYLGDAGQAELAEALASGRYRVEVPEEAALGIAVRLLQLGFAGQALDLVAELRPCKAIGRPCDHWSRPIAPFLTSCLLFTARLPSKQGASTAEKSDIAGIK
jgi:hypothetical protein